MKHHILHNSCASDYHKQPFRWDEIVRANIPEINGHNANKATDYKKGIFGKTELLFKRITIENTPAGTVWGCTDDGCTYRTEDKQSIRNHLAMMHRETNTGKVYCPYCEKNTHIGNLKTHLAGFIGEM